MLVPKRLFDELRDAANGESDRGQLGVFMVLVMGAIALVVVSIVLLLGLQIAGEFTLDGTAVTEAESFSPDSTGEYVYEVNRTPADDDVLRLGDNVTVTEDGTELTAGDDYEWDPDTGELTILNASDTATYDVDYTVYESEFANAATSTEDSTGEAFELFGTSILVVPAAAVLAVLIGGLVGAVSMRGRLPGLNGDSNRDNRR
ncbi:MAG: hypothetical protein ACOCR6_02760 [archaeon]